MRETFISVASTKAFIGRRSVGVSRLWTSAKDLSSFPAKYLTGGKTATIVRGMNFAQLVRRYGKTDTEIAARLKVSRQLVAYWRKNGISKTRAAWLREKANGTAAGR